jgi:hypothetical protein
MRNEKRRVRGVAMVVTAALLGAGGTAWARERTYEGDVVAVDGKANTFTVKATKPGEQAEMAFHFNPHGSVYLDGGRVFFAEIERGDHVSVAYETAGTADTVRRIHGVKGHVQEMTFTGKVSAVDPKGQSFTVTRTKKGETSDMQFHVDPATRLYVGGEEAVLVAQLHKGDTVTVNYETVSPSIHTVKHLKKGA